MEASEMKPGIRYVVTGGSTDGTIVAGDHVWLDDDGALICREAGGWIAPKDVESATTGAEVEIDFGWLDQRAAKLDSELSLLASITLGLQK